MENFETIIFEHYTPQIKVFTDKMIARNGSKHLREELKSLRLQKKNALETCHYLHNDKNPSEPSSPVADFFYTQLGIKAHTSTFIDGDGITMGYGDIDSHGWFEYACSADIIKEKYGTMIWNEVDWYNILPHERITIRFTFNGGKVTNIPKTFYEQNKDYWDRQMANKTIIINQINKKPNVTTSMMTQTTTGIEPVFMASYKRRRKINPNESK